MVQEEHLDNLLDEIERLIEAGDVHAVIGLLGSRHPADQADIIEHLEDEDHQRLLVAALPTDLLAEVIEFMDEDVRARVLRDLPSDTLVEVIDEVDEDLAADILQ